MKGGGGLSLTEFRNGIFFYIRAGCDKKLISCEPETLMKFFLQKIFTYFYKHPHEAQSFYEVFTLIAPCPASLKWLARGLRL